MLSEKQMEEGMGRSAEEKTRDVRGLRRLGLLQRRGSVFSREGGGVASHAATRNMHQCVGVRETNMRKTGHEVQVIFPTETGGGVFLAAMQNMLQCVGVGEMSIWEEDWI